MVDLLDILDDCETAPDDELVARAEAVQRTCASSYSITWAMERHRAALRDFEDRPCGPTGIVLSEAAAHLQSLVQQAERKLADDEAELAAIDAADHAAGLLVDEGAV